MESHHALLLIIKDRNHFYTVSIYNQEIPVHVRWCGTPSSKSPDTCRPTSSTAHCTSSVSEMRVFSTSACLLSLCCASKVARANGAPNVKRKSAPASGRGRYSHGARRPSGISLSNPVTVSHMRMTMGGRGVSINIRPIPHLKRCKRTIPVRGSGVYSLDWQFLLSGKMCTYNLISTPRRATSLPRCRPPVGTRLRRERSR